MEEKQVVEISMAWVDIFSIIATALSLVLSVVAIVLSILFFRMSDKSAKKIEKSSNNIDSNVKRLDHVFEKLYSDTFSMVKDTVSDMRNYVYKENGRAEEKNEEEVKIQRQINDSISKALEGVQKDQFDKEQVKDLVLHFIDEYKDLEKDQEIINIKEQIINFLKKRGSATYPQLKNLVYGKNNPNKNTIELFRALIELKDNGIIIDPFELDEEGEEMITHTTPISLMKQ